VGASASTRTTPRPRRGLGPRLQRGCAACLDIGTLSASGTTQRRSPRGCYSSCIERPPGRQARPAGAGATAAAVRRPREELSLVGAEGGERSERGGGAASPRGPRQGPPGDVWRPDQEGERAKGRTPKRPPLGIASRLTPARRSLQDRGPQRRLLGAGPDGRPSGAAPRARRRPGRGAGPRTRCAGSRWLPGSAGGPG
jgi:hypothetical protein